MRIKVRMGRKVLPKHLLNIEMERKYPMNQGNSLKSTYLLGGESIRVPKCIFCKHYIDDEDAPIICKAFPKGIPDEVLWEEDEEKECNNGIRYEE